MPWAGVYNNSSVMHDVQCTVIEFHSVKPTLADVLNDHHRVHELFVVGRTASIVH